MYAIMFTRSYRDKYRGITYYILGRGGGGAHMWYERESLRILLASHALVSTLCLSRMHGLSHTRKLREIDTSLGAKYCYAHYNPLLSSVCTRVRLKKKKKTKERRIPLASRSGPFSPDTRPGMRSVQGTVTRALSSEKWKIL